MKFFQRRPLLSAYIILIGLVLIVGLTYLVAHRGSQAGINRVVYQSGLNYLVVEALDDDLVHFEFSSQGPVPSPDRLIEATPMVFKIDYKGPKRFTNYGKGTLETADLLVKVDTFSLCITLTDKTRTPALVLTKACPTATLFDGSKFLTLTPEGMHYLYGLGEQLLTPTKTSLNWVNQRRTPGNNDGNAMVGFYGGATGNAQFPILYALGDNNDNYALFADSQYAQTWDFTSNPWEMQTHGKALRWYVLSGPDLPDLRQDFMELVGRPPVPPRKFFGLWVSEYGFDNWDELDDKLRTLRANNFPIDGFVMDLQWYGGVSQSTDSKMGNLSWNTVQFPDPAGKIVELRRGGVGLMTMEESYISKGLPEFNDLLQRGFLVKSCADCTDTPILFKWWGIGSMIDWTDPAAGDYWHNLKRQPLIDMGIIGHWTDLGEPEMYDPKSYYYGFPELNLHSQADVHNLYNYRWSESIARGYTLNNVTQRPFVLSRSGTAGIQRFGTVMWSGDIGSNLLSLTAHLTTQAHMSLSGMDFFGADIGGFHRDTAGGDLKEIYTKWFAAASLLDVPMRPHTENLCNCKQTAPDRVGDLQSNLANLRLRYTLSPYLYSLAYRAHLYGEPFAPPLLYYYQADPNVRDLGDEKLLGRDLLVATLTQLGESQRDVYLPAGTWVNFATNEWTDSTGAWLSGVSAVHNDLFSQPLFARAGAILPMMYVDEKTINMLGLRSDGSMRDELIVRAYASPTPTHFTFYEDDGQTIAYLQGQVRTTALSLQQSGERATVTIDAASGTYEGAPEQRDNVVQLVLRQSTASSVKLNGIDLPELKTQAEFDVTQQGWFNAGGHLILAKSGKQDVKTKKTFEFTLGG
jgi:alpha-glucosidase